MSRVRPTAAIFLSGLIMALTFASAADAAWFEKYGIRSKRDLAEPASALKLIDALRDRDASVRRAAVKCLARQGASAREAVPALVEVLKDRHPNVRAEAAHALGAMGKEGLGAGPALVEALADRNANVRRNGIRSLKRLGYDGGKLRAVLQQMASNDPHRRVKNEAAAVLASLESRGAPPTNPAEPAAAARSTTARTDAELPESSEVNRYGVAVVIGNRHYASSGKDVPDVDFAHNDADAIFRYVTQTLGFREGNVILLKDAGQADFVATFGEEGNPKGKLHDWLRPDRSDVFVYYSGHGAPSLRNGRSYLLPVDGDPLKVELNGYPLETLYANLAQLPARRVTVVIDACFSGVSAGGSVVKNASSITLRTVEEKPVDSRLTVLTASRPTQVASWDGNSRHGLFTTHFIQGVSNAADLDPFGDGDGKVTLNELGKYLEEEVAYQARRHYGRDQNPQVRGNPGEVMAELRKD